MGTFRNETITGTVNIDGHSYHNCRFEGTELVYSGGPSGEIVGCVFHEVTWTLKGAALNTVGFMKAVAGDPGMKHLIRNTFPEVFGH